MSRFLRSIIGTLVTVFFVNSIASAQTWKYSQPIKAVSNFFQDTTNIAVLVKVDTKSPISKGTMHFLGNDIRFGNCSVIDKYPYYIEQGGQNDGTGAINSLTTNIWIF